jgi:hypothetical protein
MAVKVGDTVHVLGWDTINGQYVEEYELVGIAADSITLKHLATYRHKTKLAGSGLIEQRPLKYLSYFEIPLAERVGEQKEFLDWLCQQFRKP